MDEQLRSKAQCDVNNYTTVLYILETADKNPIVREESQKSKGNSSLPQTLQWQRLQKRGI